MGEVAQLRTKRSVLKGQLTRFSNFFENIDNADEVANEVLSQLRVRLDKIEPLFEEFNELQTKIEILDTTELEKDDRESFEKNYFEVIGKVKTCLNLHDEMSEASVRSARVGNGSETNVNSNVGNQNNFLSLVKLPPIKMPTFDGKYDRWLEFKDVFLALVHDNESLSKIQKFYYLRESLEKDASEALKSINVCADNYEVAWQFLIERYERKNLIINNHLHDMFEYPKIYKESHIELRNICDSFVKHLKALKALGENTESWDRLVIYLIANKLDVITRRDWENYKFLGNLPTINDILTFLRQKSDLLEKMNYFKTNKTHELTTNKKPATRSYGLAATDQSETTFKCYFCQGLHPIYRCDDFLKHSIENRIEQVKRLKLCFICLRNSHPTWKCKMKKCFKCKGAHNTILHLPVRKENNQTNNTPTLNSNNPEPCDATVPSTTAATAVWNLPLETGERMSTNDAVRSETHALAGAEDCEVARLCDSSQVLLSTVVVKLKCFDGRFIEARALLDSGSQSNFMSTRICDLLNIRPQKIEHIVKGVGQTITHVNKRVNVDMSSKNNEFMTRLNCLVVSNIICKLPNISFKKEPLKIPSNFYLADPQFNVCKEIDLLLGSDVFWRVLKPGHHMLGVDLPVLKNTVFGWVVAGKMAPNDKYLEKTVSCLSLLEPERPLEEIICKFWNIEEVGSNKNLTDEERYCEEYFEKTVERDTTGRYIVKIPFKPEVKDLGYSRDKALKRFHLLETKLKKNPDLAKEYKQFMLEYQDLKHMSEVELKNEEGYFLPHHAVLKSTSVTTKCRVVFDSSCKTNNNLSLNDVQYVGPTLQQDIFSILSRFRLYKYVMTADVSKMFRQILVAPEHRKYQKIFWRDNQNDNLKVFTLNTVTYGNASSPYLAVKCLFHLASQNVEVFPNVSNIIKRDFYIDDLLTGGNNKDVILNLQRDITKVLNSAGFQLRKWLCNDKDLLKNFELFDDLEINVLNIGQGEQNKTLGVFWDSNEDVITYKINVSSVLPLRIISKRSILSVVCQVFDPLGLVGPVIIKAKLIIQELWRAKIGWDDELPSNTLKIWLDFQKDLEFINQIQIPRQVVFSNYISLELHGFSDASEKAYGACLYIRCVMSSNVFICNLLCAKSRVAPIKQISLPRLELCAALLLSNLYEKAKDSLELDFDRTFFWTDSQIVLAWIKDSPGRWKTFVGNRVSEIQSLTKNGNWAHVKSLENPADLLSRGISSRDLKNNDLWWKGPRWFQIENSSWSIPVFDNLEVIPEERKTVTCLIVNNEDSLVNNLLKRFSSFKRICKVLAYILRFISNIKFKDKRLSGNLNLEEINTAKNLLITFVQREVFAKEYVCLLSNKPLSKNSKILSLNPFLKDNLIHVGGRLKNANQPFAKRHPIILPSGHTLTKLILIYEHERLLHCGAQMLLCSIRESYWPLSGRKNCKSIVRSCVKCFKTNPRPNKYLMGDLPSIRVNDHSVFLNVGTDFGGPFMLKDRKTRGAKLSKAYMCLFICMSVKAVHLELVSELTTDAFLAAFKRFISRRGRPVNVYSDNGTNYTGANNELKRMYDFLSKNSNEISNKLVDEMITWHFIPAKSPSFGGIWEAGIKSAKSHIKRVIGNHSLTFEEFTTVLTQIESVLNSRPLCPMTSDPEDFAALTPSHFLIGRQLTALPEPSLTNIPENRLKKWQLLQSMVQHYWSRWHKEYLSELQTRVKWREKSPELLRVGSLVLLREDNMPSLSWPLGRVVQLCPGKDGETRVVKILVRDKEVLRAVNRVCTLPIDNIN